MFGRSTVTSSSSSSSTSPFKFFLELGRRNTSAEQRPEVLCRVVVIGEAPRSHGGWSAVFSLLVKHTKPTKSTVCHDSAEMHLQRFGRHLRIRFHHRHVSCVKKVSTPDDLKLVGVLLLVDLDQPGAFLQLLTDVETVEQQLPRLAQLKKLLLAISARKRDACDYDKVRFIALQRGWQSIFMASPVASSPDLAISTEFTLFLGHCLASLLPEARDSIERRLNDIRPSDSSSSDSLKSDRPLKSDALDRSPSDSLKSDGDEEDNGHQDQQRTSTPPITTTPTTTSKAPVHEVGSFKSVSMGSITRPRSSPGLSDSDLLGVGRTLSVSMDLDWDPNRISVPIEPAPPVPLFDSLPSLNASSASSSPLLTISDGRPRSSSANDSLSLSSSLSSLSDDQTSSSSNNGEQPPSCDSQGELLARFLEAEKATHGVLPDSPVFYQQFDPAAWVRYGYANRRQTNHRLSCASLDGWLPPAWKLEAAHLARQHAGAWRELTALLQQLHEAADMARFETALRALLHDQRGAMTAEQLLCLEQNNSTALHLANVAQVEVMARLWPAAVQRALNHSHCAVPPLHFASATCNLELLHCFAKWTDFSPLDYKARSCLYHACMSSQARLRRLPDAESRLLKVAEFLIDRWPAAVNLPSDDSGRTPIFSALLEGHTSLVELLISRGAALRLCDVHGQSPLHIAVLSGSLQLVEIVARSCPVLIHHRFWAQNVVGGGALQLSPYQDAVTRARSSSNAASVRTMNEQRSVLDSQFKEALIARLVELRRAEEACGDAGTPGGLVERTVASYAADFVQHMVFEMQAIFGDVPKPSRGKSPVGHWLSSYRYLQENAWPEHASYSSPASPTPTPPRSFTSFCFAAAHFSYPVLVWLYDQEFTVQNAFLLQFQRWLVEQNPLSLAVNPKHVKVWWPKSPPTDPELAARAEQAAAAVASASSAMQQFVEARCPGAKARHFERFLETLGSTLADLTGGEGDPDFLLFIRAWVMARVSVPNIASIYALMVDWLLKGQEPADDFEAPYAYTLFQLSNIIETLRAMRDTTTYLVAQIEARFRGVMRSCSPKDVELFSTICANLDAAKAHHYRFAGFAQNVASLQWFAQDWDLTIEQDANDAVVTINNPQEFPLRPHVCEAVSLKMASFTN